MSGCATNYYVRAYATNITGTGYGNSYNVVYAAVPNITTSTPSSITPTSAVVGGNISNDGGCPINERGICWGINANPTILGNHTAVGNGIGSFSTTIVGLLSNFTYHLRSYSTNSTGTTYGEDVQLLTSVPNNLYIGQNYAGGIIFYLDATGNHGIVCASTDQGRSSFGCSGILINGIDSIIGSGLQNTANIVASCAFDTIAPRICSDLILNGYNDWYLPSKKELQLLYTNLYLNNIGAFISQTNIRYCSSTQSSATTLWALDFSNGIWSSGQSKYSTFLPVRAVRTF
jgi:hypothetical protein